MGKPYFPRIFKIIPLSFSHLTIALKPYYALKSRATKQIKMNTKGLSNKQLNMIAQIYYFKLMIAKNKNFKMTYLGVLI